MRHCLSCHGFSADGPLCTQCGRSFGGRLCRGKKRHLNPPDAVFCGQCGTTDLEDAAGSLPLGCLARGLALGVFLWLTMWIVSHTGNFLWQWSGQAFKAITGFSSPAVWLIEQSARVLMFLFVFYVLSIFMPGAAGEQFRGLITKLCLEALRGLFHLFGIAIRLVWQMLLGSIARGRGNAK
jgi:hypothetical protein